MTTLAEPVDERDGDVGPDVVVADDAPRAGSGPRVASVDALRGLTIFLMVFVNDLGHAAPSWLHHIQPPRADGMTVADVVFPSFLFIVGLAIPLAFERARQAGASRWLQFRHILGRTVALLLMGVIEMNHDDDTTLGGRYWGLLAFVSLVLAWSSIPREPGWKRKTFFALKGLGVVGVLVALAVYRRPPVSTDVLFLGHVESWVWLRSGWWGILGLIGWAYLTVSLLNLFLGHRREWLMGSMGLLMMLHLTMRNHGLFHRVENKAWLAPARGLFAALDRGVDWVGSYVGLGDATGSLAAIAMAGCLLGSILRRDSDVVTHRDRIRWALTFAFGLFVAGALTDTFEGINKIGATPTWCFWCAALATTVWAGLYALMDVAGFRAWSVVVRPAGANPLLAYFLHPITIWVVGLAGFGSKVLGYTDSNDPGTAVLGSALMALFVCTAAGLLGRLGLRVRL